MRSTLITIALLVTSCASNKPTPAPPVADARADGSFLFLTARGAETATPASLRHAMTTLCDPTCDRVYVDVDDQPSVAALSKIAEVARTVSPAPRLYLMPATKKAIELSLLDDECNVVVQVKDRGAAVFVQDDPLEPDPACDAWNMPICRGDDDRYDWPRLRSEVGDTDEICVAFETPTAAQLAELHETLRQPRIRLVAPRATEATIAETAVSSRVQAAATDLQWCLDGEVADTEQVPMEATLRIAVHADGTVTRVDVLEPVRTTSNFEACIAAVTQKFRFEPTDAPATAAIRLRFEPGGSGPIIVE